MYVTFLLPLERAPKVLAPSLSFLKVGLDREHIYLSKDFLTECMISLWSMDIWIIIWFHSTRDMSIGADLLAINTTWWFTSIWASSNVWKIDMIWTTFTQPRKFIWLNKVELTSYLCTGWKLSRSCQSFIHIGACSDWSKFSNILMYKKSNEHKT